MMDRKDKCKFQHTKLRLFLAHHNWNVSLFATNCAVDDDVSYKTEDSLWIELFRRKKQPEQEADLRKRKNDVHTNKSSNDAAL